MNQTAAKTGASTRDRQGGFARGNYLLVAAAVAVLVGVYLVGKASPAVSFRPIGDGWFGEGLVLLFAAALFALMLLGPARARTTPRRRMVLMAVRLAVIVLVVLMMLRPQLVYHAISRRSATLVLMIDTSASMKTDDEPGQSRYARLRETLADAADDLAELAKDLDLRVYAFDTEQRALKVTDGKIELPESPEGEQTAIGYCLAEVIKDVSGQRLAAVLLLSDGSQRAIPSGESDAHAADPATIARQHLLKGRNRPLYAVVYGQTESQVHQRDVILESLTASDSIFVGNRLTANAEARLIGYASQTLDAQLLWEVSPGKMDVVEATPVRTGRSGEPNRFNITYAPQAKGLYKLIVRLPTRPGELDTENNEQATIVRVTGGGLRVLYIEGTYRVETRNLLRSLGSAEHVEVDFVRLRVPPPGEAAPPRPPSVAQTIEQALDPKDRPYDVFILGDLPASAFHQGELDKLRERVRQGSGLIMLGGVLSFGPGNYATTPLADVLPITMTETQRQDPGGELRTDQHHLGERKLRPTPQAAGDFLTLITTPEKNPQRWAELPPLLNGANKLEPKVQTILLEDQEGKPMLVSGQFGAGRVLAFAGDSTWRWVTHGFEEEHKRFWRQLVLWLGRKDQAEEGRVWVEASRRSGFAGQKIRFTAGVRDTAGKPMANYDLTAELVVRDNDFQEIAREPIAFSRQGNQRVTEYTPTRPGDYLLTVRAMSGGQEIGTAGERFLVRAAKQLEMQRPVPDQAAMEKLAAITGGRAVAPSELDDILAELKKVPRELEERVRTVSSLWDPLRIGPFARLGIPITLAALAGFAIAGLLSVEWYLRKKWGLV